MSSRSLANRKISFFKPISLFILDSAKFNLTEEVQKKLKKHSKIPVISKELTKLL